MIPSGTTPAGTTDDNPVVAMTFRETMRKLIVINEGANPGFFAINSTADDHWARLPAGPTSVSVDLTYRPVVGGKIYIKRVAGGANVSGVFVIVS